MKRTMGIDLGGTSIGAVIVQEDGLVIWESDRRTLRDKDYNAVVERIASFVSEGQREGELSGIGIGVPGPVDQRTGRVYECVNLGWDEVDLAKDLTTLTGISVKVMNDASVAAYGEFVAGALQGVDEGLMLTLGTGVGGGAIVHGKLFEGRHGLGMEVGHLKIGEGNYRCSCGRTGCFETYTSATALVREAHARLAESGPTSWLDARKSFNAKVIFDGAQSGDAFCEDLINRWIHYLAIGVLDLRMIFDPEVIAFSGGLSNAGQFWLPKLEHAVIQMANFKRIPLPELVLAKLGERAGAIGAAHRVMKND